MDRITFAKKLPELIKKYKYALAVLLVGLILMTVPFGETNETKTQTNHEVQASEPADMSEKLEQILSMIQGAGDVRVFLTVATGEKTLYQTDTDQTNGDNSSLKTDTVIITDSNRGQAGLIQQINPVTYMGAIIVCQGADIAQVRLSIAEAVAKVTGLGMNQISVLKMK